MKWIRFSRDVRDPEDVSKGLIGHYFSRAWYYVSDGKAGQLAKKYAGAITVVSRRPGEEVRKVDYVAPLSKEVPPVEEWEIGVSDVDDEAGGEIMGTSDIEELAEAEAAYEEYLADPDTAVNAEEVFDKILDEETMVEPVEEEVIAKVAQPEPEEPAEEIVVELENFIAEPEPDELEELLAEE